jgi:glycosyltransferase involved in cell wall biosynthesis
MTARAPEVSVVVATRDRADMLRRLLASLSGQAIEPARFEVIVVDDGSRDGTADLLRREAERGGLSLRSIARERPGGRAAARNLGWRAARAPVVAFTDDDCVAAPRWLVAGLESARANPGAIVQGRTSPDPEGMKSFNPFSHTVSNPRPTPWFETCNVAYPRELLERVGGFEEAAFHKEGEDADLAWRAIASGAGHVFAPDALVHHAVVSVGPLGKLRYATRRSDAVLCMARHPEIRRRHLWRRVFYSRDHELLLRAAVALVLPRRLGWLRLWLAAPYVDHLTSRRSGPLLAPYLVLVDLVETVTCVAAAIRRRVFVL